jgi:hypothetical protein
LKIKKIIDIMKTIFSALFVVLFATSVMAQTGLTCNDPIPVDKSYTAQVNAGDELWYTASTWDLPMHVYFSPDIDNSTWGPEVQIDFTCNILQKTSQINRKLKIAQRCRSQATY